MLLPTNTVVLSQPLTGWTEWVNTIVPCSCNFVVLAPVSRCKGWQNATTYSTDFLPCKQPRIHSYTYARSCTRTQTSHQFKYYVCFVCILMWSRQNKGSHYGGMRHCSFCLLRINLKFNQSVDVCREKAKPVPQTLKCIKLQLHIRKGDCGESLFTAD